MAGYEKTTVKSFAAKMKAEGYSDLTGARRAIGRMSTWDDKEKAKAHKLANAFFEAAPSATKAAPAASKARAPKKKKKRSNVEVAKNPRGASKAPKKVSKKVSKAAPTKRAAKAPAKRAARAPRAPRTEAAVAPVAPPEDKIDRAGRRINVVRATLEVSVLAKSLGAPDDAIAQGALKAQEILTETINSLVDVSPEEVAGAAAFEKAAIAAKAVEKGSNGATSAPVLATPAAMPVPTTTPPLPG